MPKGGDRGGRKPLKWKIRDGAPRPAIRLEVPKDFRLKLEAIALAWDKGLISVEQIDELLTRGEEVNTDKDRIEINMTDLESALRVHFKNGGNQREVNQIVQDVLSEQPTQKIVINDCFGGFELSPFAIEELSLAPYSKQKNCRTNPDLIRLIELHGSEKVSGCSAELVIEEVPIAADWTVNERDGRESLRW